MLHCSIGFQNLASDGIFIWALKSGLRPGIGEWSLYYPPLILTPAMSSMKLAIAEWSEPPLALVHE